MLDLNGRSLATQNPPNLYILHPLIPPPPWFVTNFLFFPLLFRYSDPSSGLLSPLDLYFAWLYYYEGLSLSLWLCLKRS